MLIQLDTVLCADTKIYMSADRDLAVTLSDFYGHPGDGCDSLFWRTESESDNLGFNLYRRIVPLYLDSVKKVVESTLPDSLLDNGQLLFRMGVIGYRDTLWVKVFNELIPAAGTGTSQGPNDYLAIDNQVYNDVLYEYTLIIVSRKGRSEQYGLTQVKPQIILPREFAIYQNFPNPIVRFTFFRFDVPKKASISLNVYNLKGQTVARIIKPNRIYKPGRYKVRWDCVNEAGRPLGAGPYVYRFMTPGYVKARLMIVVR